MKAAREYGQLEFISLPKPGDDPHYNWGVHGDGPLAWIEALKASTFDKIEHLGVETRIDSLTPDQPMPDRVAKVATEFL